jgi:hypothetical protein
MQYAKKTSGTLSDTNTVLHTVCMLAKYCIPPFSNRSIKKCWSCLYIHAFFIQTMSDYFKTIWHPRIFFFLYICMGFCVYVPLPPLRGQHTVLCHPRWLPTSGLTEFAVCWVGAGFEPRTTDLQSGALPLSHLSSWHPRIIYIISGSSNRLPMCLL